MLQTGVSPSRFPWNGWGENQPFRQSVFDHVNARLGVSEELQACVLATQLWRKSTNNSPAEDDREPASDHNDYAHNSAGVVDAAAAAETIRQLEAKIMSLEIKLRDIPCTLNVNRLCKTDEEFRFYTQRKCFGRFGNPSPRQLPDWCIGAQRTSDAMALEKPSPNRRLQLVDEFFLYCCRVAVGMKEKVIADIFGISTTTVVVGVLHPQPGSQKPPQHRQQRHAPHTLHSVPACQPDSHLGSTGQKVQKGVHTLLLSRVLWAKDE
ncbi:hypothetical protein NHX12_033053 [Muraenolepis orangiensis]|uniref:Transposase Helix-turn-helix domain-containing protein n=1 Tax=Muraenolepis orangiensis TaxID=630683 RepID=A0A9Q0E5A5_9TELE|nr:hypothetical protein NHX12_033053 [Muraenolepis orangiensis]